MLLTLLSGLKLPAISAVGDSASGTNITVTFTTDIAAYDRIQWGTSSGNYSGGTIDNVGSLETAHNILLEAADGIAESTFYYYHVGASTDGTNWNYSAEGTFATDPAYQFQDTFTGANADPLSASWTEHTSYASGGAEIQSNMAANATTVNSLFYVNALTDTATFDIDVSAYFNVNDFNMAAIVACVDTAADTYYKAIAFSAGFFQIIKRSAGTDGAGSGVDGTNFPTVGNSVALRLTVSGGIVTLYAGGTQVCQLDDSGSPLPAGRCGLLWNNKDFRFDNFTVN